MDRRRAIAAIGAFGGVMATLMAGAQQERKLWRVGVLMARSRSSVQKAAFDAIFSTSLRKLGYVEGKNILIEWRYAEGKYERLPGLAAELLQLKPDVIVAWAPPSVQAAKQATSTIPIVMVGLGDPVASGFVASLSRPGGNVTGLSNLTVELSVKYLELLQAVAPKLRRVAVLLNPNNPAHTDVLRNVQASAKTSGVRVIPVEARTEAEIEAAFGAMTRSSAGALIIEADSFFVSQVQQIAGLALKHKLPSIYVNRGYAEAGGLMSYGQDLTEIFRRAAIYVDKIFKGAKPGELPVEQATKVELVINHKTAKALGITISKELLLRADEVIE